MKIKLQLPVIILFITVVAICINLFTNKTQEEVYKTNTYTSNYVVVEEMKNTVIESASIHKLVYDDLTLEELADKLNRVLNSTISGKGMLIASYALEKEVDPYMAVAIMLHETGCKWTCSYLVRTCNNVGGQKGSGCGNYSSFDSLDEGIKAFIDNLSRNYVSKGLNTPELINTKYASDKSWSSKVNKYIEVVKEA